MSARFWFYPLHCLFHPNFGRANQTCCFYSTHPIRSHVCWLQSTALSMSQFSTILSYEKSPPGITAGLTCPSCHRWTSLALEWNKSVRPTVRARHRWTSLAPQVISPTQCHFGADFKSGEGWFMVIPHILLWLSSHVLVSIWSEMTWPYFLNKTGNGKESWSVPLHTTAKPRDQAGCFSQHAPFILMLFGRTKRCHPKKYKTVWPMPQVSGKCVEKTIIWRLFRPTDPPQRVPTYPNISSCPLALGVTGAPACQLMFKKPTSR